MTSIEGQPVLINWLDDKGREHRYTPDFLIHFKPSGEQFPPFQPGKVRPWLVEIKDEKTLREQWREFRPRFRAAVAYARARGWLFHLFVERHLRSPRLANARLLLSALDFPEQPSICERLLLELARLGEATAHTLVDEACRQNISRTDCLQALWRLVLQRRIETNLKLPLGMNSRLRLPGDHFVDALIRLNR